MSPWLVALAVGVAALLLLGWRLARPRPRLVLGERGILDRGLGWGWIPWDEIEGAYPPSADEGETVRLRVRFTDRLARTLHQRRRLPLADPPDGRIEVRLDLSATGLTAVDVLQEILARHGGGPASAV